jgi:hypothetical protein
MQDRGGRLSFAGPFRAVDRGHRSHRYSTGDIVTIRVERSSDDIVMQGPICMKGKRSAGTSMGCLGVR